MNDFIDARLEPSLWLLCNWSLRWGVLIAMLGIWFALHPPRQAALRLAICQLVLVAGLALPLVPRWWSHDLLPAWSVATVDVPAAPAMTAAPERAIAPQVAEPQTATVPPLSGPAPRPQQSEPEIPATEPMPHASAPIAKPLGPFRILLLIAAALWCVGTCAQLIRLIAGVICLSSLPRGARRPSLPAQELFDRCREEIGLHRSVRLRIHPTLASPVFVGGWRSSVLVPIEWERLTPEVQRAVLWHELTHALRRDDLAKLATEVIRAAFFFHPLVRWLLNRIDAYREQVCDSAAVCRGTTGRMLAQILVDFSRRSAAPGQRDSALEPALPFFRRRTVRNRIRELLDETTVARWSAPLGRRQFVGIALVAIAIGVALGGFGSYAADLPPEQPPANDAALQAPGPVTPPKPAENAAATPKAAAASKTLERILANWKARQERMQSLYFSWESRLFFGPKGEDVRSGVALTQKADARSSRFTFWAQPPDRFRLDSAPLRAPKPEDTVFAIKTHSVINRTTECRVEDPGNAAGSPVATLETRRGQSLLSTPAGTRNGLALSLYPPDAFLLNPRSGQFRVIAENALSFDGLHCVKIQNSNENGTIFENCFVDPARDDIIVAYELRLGSWRDISIRYQRDRVHGWIPARWTFNEPGMLSENTVTKYAINEPFPEEIFTLQPSPGTIVFDEQTAEQYRVAKDGAKSDVAQFDSARSLEIAKALESLSDFRIERQSLKDAIDFIAARYQIPIVVHKADYEAAGVKPPIEVGPLPSGIRVADLLTRLWAKCPKPVGFRIEDEVLKISPKFAGQGPIQAGPVAASPKLASAKARKIQEALEMPVDFNVEPQSLKDALDWIAARYQIRIKSDPLMDAMIEVKGAFPGIKLRSLLSILLEQCPGPQLGFKIERDALKIYPKGTNR